MRSQRGSSMVEYILIVMFVAMVCVGIEGALGDAVSRKFQVAASSLVDDDTPTTSPVPTTAPPLTIPPTTTTVPPPTTVAPTTTVPKHCTDGHGHEKKCP